MTHDAPSASPDEVLAAGSLIEVPVTVAQANAVSCNINERSRATKTRLGLHSWLIPAPEARLTSASIVATQLEVHYLYIPNIAFNLANPPVGLEVVVYDDDGTVLSDQDYGVTADAA